MAGQYYFKVSEAADSKSINVFDKTKPYNSTNNTGGYGAPNFALSDVLTASMTVTFPDLTKAPVTVDLFDDELPYPTTNDDLAKSVTNVMLGLPESTILKDGVYYFYSVITGLKSGVPFTSESSKYVVFSNQVDAFFDAMTKSLVAPDCGCDCNEVETYELDRLKNLLEAAKKATCNGQVENARMIMTYLIKMAGCNKLTLCGN